MLILALAHAQKSGDRSLISRYYSLLLRWADFLVKRSLDNVSALWVHKFRSVSLDFTIYSITADGSYSAMSNLALKGITGIYAMGKINQLLEGHVYGADTNRTSHYLASYKYSSLIHDFLMFLTNKLYYYGTPWTRESNLFQCRKRPRIMRNDGRTSLCLHKAILCRSSGTSSHGGSCTISTQ